MDTIPTQYPIQVLFVENRAELARREADRCTTDFGDKVNLHWAPDVEAAKKLIGSEFFHVAFVDLKLGGDFENGRDVLFRLKRESPTTVRFAMSKYANDRTASVLTLVRPPAQLAHGFIRKEPARSLVAETLAEFLSERSTNALRVFELDVLLGRLRSLQRRLRLEGVSDEGLASEVYDLISHVIGFVDIEGLEGSSSVRLSPMTQGLSASVLVDALVILGEDQAGDPVEGNHAVLKFGARASIAEEVDRFQRVVKHGVKLSARVELVGHALGPRLGCVCYSFAGGAPDAAQRLDDWVDIFGRGKLTATVSRRVHAVLEQLFAPNARNWYAVNAGRKPADSYFEYDLKTKYMERLTTVHNWAERVAEANQWSIRGRYLKIGDSKLQLPDEQFFGSTSLGRECRFTLVHGDMHGGNVLVTLDGVPALIDFAQCGPGPLAIDAAVLQGTIRLWDSRSLPTDRRAATKWIGARLSREQAVARSLSLVRSTARSGIGPWEQLSRGLNDLLRDNYRVPEDEWPAAAQEVTIVQCLQAARLLSLDIGDSGRLRILCWFAALAPTVEQWGS